MAQKDNKMENKINGIFVQADGNFRSDKLKRNK